MAAAHTGSTDGLQDAAFSSRTWNVRSRTRSALAHPLTVAASCSYRRGLGVNLARKLWKFNKNCRKTMSWNTLRIFFLEITIFWLVSWFSRDFSMCAAAGFKSNQASVACGNFFDIISEFRYLLTLNEVPCAAFSVDFHDKRSRL